MEGLEISVLNLTEINDVNFGRIDSEYYLKKYLNFEKIIKNKECFKVSDFSIVTDGEHGSPDLDENSGIYYLSGNNIKENSIDLSDIRFCSEKLHLKNLRSSIKKNNVLMSIVGTVGKASVVYEEFLGNTDRNVATIKEIERINPFYLSVFLNSKYGKFQTERFSTGNVQPLLNLLQVKSILINNLNFEFQNTIEKSALKSFRLKQKSQQTYQQAENLLLEELGLLPYNEDTVKTLNYYLTEHLRTNSIDNIIEGKEFVEADLLEEAEFWNKKLENLQKPQNYKPENYEEIERVEQEIEKLIEKIKAKIQVSEVVTKMAHKHNAAVLALQSLQQAEKKNHNIKNFSESFGKTGRIDAEYYQPKYEEIIEKIRSFENKNLGNLVEIKKSIEPGSSAYQEEGIPFIRVSNLTKFGLSNPEIHLNKNEFSDTIKPKKDTILLSKDGTVGIAYKVSEDMEAITSGAILHLEINNSKILPDYLTLVLNSKIVQLQAERDSGGSIIQHWKPSEISEVLIPILEKSTQEKISSLVQESFLLKKQSEELLELAKKAVETAIEEGEEKGMEVLDKIEII